ncbi:MAG: protein translocase subunit SecF [Helicobacter sp.]|nr:protein translocase subunit SecF [Helicobacter sp.]MDE6044529.1 protein translocase subunit SecF [Helicobacter sp.]
MELFKSQRVYDFVGMGKYTIWLSLVLVLGSIVLYLTQGFRYGIDFSGGSIVQIQYKAPVAPIAEVRAALSTQRAYDGFSVSEFGAPNEILIRLPIATSNIASDLGATLAELLAPTGELEIRRVDVVGPKVGDELRNKGILALTLASIGILIYVAFRYEWRFALASLLALAHDIIIACGAVIIFNIDFGLDVLAALLTLLGYSINDTIIIFDRIRERMQKSTKESLQEVMNEAVSRTLSRTLLTTLTLLLTLVPLFLFGGDIIIGFTLPMLVGTFVGSYSSIFIAMLFAIWLGFDLKKYQESLRAKEAAKREKQKLRSMYAKGTL